MTLEEAIQTVVAARTQYQAVHQGVPVACVPKTTIRTFMAKGEEENEGLRPRIP